MSGGISRGSAEKTEAYARQLGRLDDIFDRIDRRREERNRMFAVADCRVVEAYKEGWVCAVAKVSFRGRAGEYNLSFSAIEDGFNRFELMKTGALTTPNRDLRSSDVDGNECRMHRMTQLVQHPEGFPIPSLVWLESSKYFHDGVGDVLANLSPINKIAEFVEPIANRELSRLQSGIAGNFRSRKAGLIKGRTDGQHCVGRRVDPALREGFSELEFEALCGAVRISLDDQISWMIMTVTPDSVVEIGDMVFRAQKTAFGAIKGIIGREGHDKIRSDERL